jgi:hypothetical protein
LGREEQVESFTVAPASAPAFAFAVAFLCAGFGAFDSALASRFGALGRRSCAVGRRGATLRIRVRVLRRRWDGKRQENCRRRDNLLDGHWGPFLPLTLIN